MPASLDEMIAAQRRYDERRARDVAVSEIRCWVKWPAGPAPRRTGARAPHAPAAPAGFTPDEYRAALAARRRQIGGTR